MTMIHVNEVHFEGEDRWTKQFNLCSDYFIKSQDKSLSDEERKEWLDKWFEERQRLELGIY